MFKNDLSPEMQARLDRWKERLPPPKNAGLFKNRDVPSYVARRGDHGDEVEKRPQQNKETHGTAGK
jgi:hypothetical protein